MTELKIQYKNIDEITPYINNPRINNDNAVDKVANSIKEFGFKNPIIVDSNNVIVAGHTRLLSAKKLNLEKVPTISADDLTTEQIRAFRVADNKTAEFSEWDFEALGIELEDIELDMNEFGFEIVEMDDFGEDFVLADDDAPLVATMTLTLSSPQRDFLVETLKHVDTSEMDQEENSNKTGNAVYKVVQEWKQMKDAQRTLD